MSCIRAPRPYGEEVSPPPLWGGGGGGKNPLPACCGPVTERISRFGLSRKGLTDSVAHALSVGPGTGVEKTTKREVLALVVLIAETDSDEGSATTFRLPLTSGPDP